MISISVAKELSPTRLHHNTAHKTTFCTISVVKIWKLIYVKVVSLPNDMYSLGTNTYDWNSTVSEWTTWYSRCLNLWEVKLHRRIVKLLLYILGYPLRIWYRRLVVLKRFCHVYVLWLGVSPWKVSPTVKGSRCQGHSLTEIKPFLSIKVKRHNAITQCASGNA